MHCAKTKRGVGMSDVWAYTDELLSCDATIVRTMEPDKLGHIRIYDLARNAHRRLLLSEELLSSICFDVAKLVQFI